MGAVGATAQPGSLGQRTCPCQRLVMIYGPTVGDGGREEERETEKERVGETRMGILYSGRGQEKKELERVKTAKTARIEKRVWGREESGRV